MQSFSKCFFHTFLFLPYNSVLGNFVWQGGAQNRIDLMRYISHGSSNNQKLFLPTIFVLFPQFLKFPWWVIFFSKVILSSSKFWAKRRQYSLISLTSDLKGNALLFFIEISLCCFPSFSNYQALALLSFRILGSY